MTKLKIMGEMWGYIRERKKYWLLPIIIMVFLFGILAVVGESSLAPFIYALF